VHRDGHPGQTAQRGGKHSRRHVEHKDGARGRQEALLPAPALPNARHQTRANTVLSPAGYLLCCNATTTTNVQKQARNFPHRLQAFELIRVREPQETWDVRAIMERHRRRVLAGVVLVFSRVIPLESDPRSHPLWRLAEQYGGACALGVSDATTHVVATHGGTEKARAGRRRDPACGPPAVVGLCARPGGRRSAGSCVAAWAAPFACVMGPGCTAALVLCRYQRFLCCDQRPIQVAWAKGNGKFVVSPGW
jgi:hypothetical protein